MGTSDAFELLQLPPRLCSKAETGFLHTTVPELPASAMKLLPIAVLARILPG